MRVCIYVRVCREKEGWGRGEERVNDKWGRMVVFVEFR